ncbi:hypothetical protein D3C87_1269370 [compost metagenome]
MSSTDEGMNVRLFGVISSLPTITGVGPGTSMSLPCSSVTNHRSSPGLAGFGCFGSSHGAQKRMTHSPSLLVGGLPAQITRWRTCGLSVRIQPMSVRNCVSRK